MTAATRDQLLTTARILFAERGFYGVSIANIAGALGLTKQALLHHFPTKEKLYGEVLKEISAELEAMTQAAREANEKPRTQLIALLLAMTPQTGARADDDATRTRLLMRELLDNKDRAQSAGAWYLKPFLQELAAMTTALPGWDTASEAQSLALVYQLLGAVNYYSISEATLQGIFGAETFIAFASAFPHQLQSTIEAAIDAGPAG